MLWEPGREDFPGEEMLCWWGRDFCVRVLCVPFGLAFPVAHCYFINVFISLPVLKLGVVELVLRSTDLGRFRCTVDAWMLVWNALFPERGWSGSSKPTISRKIPPPSANPLPRISGAHFDLSECFWSPWISPCGPHTAAHALPF